MIYNVYNHISLAYAAHFVVLNHLSAPGTGQLETRLQQEALSHVSSASCVVTFPWLQP